MVCSHKRYGDTVLNCTLKINYKRPEETPVEKMGQCVETSCVVYDTITSDA